LTPLQHTLPYDLNSDTLIVDTALMGKGHIWVDCLQTR